VDAAVPDMPRCVLFTGTVWTLKLARVERSNSVLLVEATTRHIAAVLAASVLWGYDGCRRATGRAGAQRHGPRAQRPLASGVRAHSVRES
jgi:hypothetical protein